MTGDLNFGDSIDANFGASTDLKIFHDHANSQNKIIGTATTIIGSDLFYINNAASDENMLKATANGSVDLYYDNSKKLETTSEGAKVTGHLRLNNSQEMQLGGSATHIEGDSGYMAFDVNSAERMRINSSGNVGIGASPSYKLDVDAGAPSSADKIISRHMAETSRQIGLVWDDSASTLGLATLTNHSLAFHTNGINPRMLIDSSGAVTMPKQPAFLAKLAGNMNNIANSTWTTIEASTEIFDQNSDYNTSTYTFTAPVTGKYQFNAMVRMENVDNNTDFQYVVFSTDNRVYYGLQSWRQTADVPQTHHQLAILADMDANDTCRVRVYIANGHQASDIADTSIWSGHLVC